jgi:hypothetical protein
MVGWLFDWLIGSIDHVDGVRHIRTVATCWPIFHSLGDMWAWRATVMMMWCPPELSGNPTSRDILEQVEGVDERVRILCLSIWDTSMDIYHAVKSYDMGPPALLPIWRKECWAIFIALKNPSSQVGFELVTLGSSGKHTDHYTTDTTAQMVTLYKQIWTLRK